MIVNYEATKAGKVRAICTYCDRKSKAVEPMTDGRPGFGLFGWSCAPHFVTTQHQDGSFGPLYTCPSCKKLRDKRQRESITPLLVPTAERLAARTACTCCGHQATEHGKYFKERPCTACDCPTFVQLAV